MAKKRVDKIEVSLEELIKNAPKQIVSTYDNPTKIETKNNDFKLGFANTIYAGSVADKTLFKNFLKYAQAENLDAVLIPGNLIWLDLVKYSKNKPNRSELVEMAQDEELKDKNVWLSLKEKLDLVVEHSLKPLFYEDNKPLYKGPIYVTFGEIEEQFVLQYTDEYAKLEKAGQKKEISSKISNLKTQKKSLEKELKKAEEDKEININLDNINKEIQELQKEKGKRGIMFNTGDKLEVDTKLAVQNYLIQKYEGAIPNSKVVSTGDGVFKVADKTLKLKHNTGNPGTFMDKLVEKARVKLSLGEAPDMVVAGGLSTAYTHAPVSYIDKEGRNKVITLMQLPTCIDEKSLKNIMDARVNSSGDEIIELVKKIDFSPGALVLEYVDGIQKRKFLPGDYLTNNNLFSNSKNLKEPKFIYEADVADQHHGSKYETLIETAESYEYAFKVSMDLLEKINAPIVRFLSHGDETQGKNYSTDQEGHREYLLPSKSNELEEKILREYANDPTRIKIELRKLKKLQEVRAGILNPQDQAHDFLDMLNYNLLKKVLENAKEAKLIGPIMYFIAGNHDQHTYEGMVKTAKDLARELQIKLNASEEEILAPILGFGGVYTGKFGVKGNYEWAEYARHKQGSSRNAKDPVKRTKNAFIKRGLDFPEFSGAYIINHSAHNHLGGQTTSKNTFHDVCYCNMDRNYYGEKYDYGSPTIGFKVMGYPIGGPSTGPIITVEFTLPYLQEWANKKPKINTKKLFENSVI